MSFPGLSFKSRPIHPFNYSAKVLVCRKEDHFSAHLDFNYDYVYLRHCGNLTVTMATSVTTMSAQTPPRTPVARVNDSLTRTQTPSPGTWKHPRMAEISRRRKAATFDGSNARRIGYNAAAFICTFVVPGLLQSYLSTAFKTLSGLTHLLGWYHWLPMLIFRLVLGYNIYCAAQPLFREPDNLSDIPLSPTQRELLGLDPASGKPGTPKAEYITPPRYQKSTPRTQSPASGRDSSGLRNSGNGGPSGGFSPSASPLWTRTVTGENRRASLGRDGSLLGNGNPMRDSIDSSSMFSTNTPSPIRGSTSGIPLNSKWLYERRSSSGSWR